MNFINPELQSPFKEKLVDSDIREDKKNKIKSIENDPNLLVKVECIENEGNLKKEVVKLKRARELFMELKNSYGVNIPNFNYVVGPDSGGNKKIYTVTERIHKKRNFFKEIKELEILYLSLLNYLSDKYKNKTDFLIDVAKSSQYVFGHKNGSSENHPYLVDIDPRYYGYDHENEGSGYLSFLAFEFARLEKSINKTRIKTGAIVYNPHRKFSEFVSSVDRESVFYKYYKKFKGEV